MICGPNFFSPFQLAAVVSVACNLFYGLIFTYTHARSEIGFCKSVLCLKEAAESKCRTI